MDRKRGQSPPYERGDAQKNDDETDADVDFTKKTDYNKEVSVLTDEEQDRIKSEVLINYKIIEKYKKFREIKNKNNYNC